jgi:hypothetical protein
MLPVSMDCPFILLLLYSITFIYLFMCVYLCVCIMCVYSITFIYVFMCVYLFITVTVVQQESGTRKATSWSVTNRNYSAILATLQITSYVHSRNSS